MSLPLAPIAPRRRGRPRKFAAPSRAVTLTLPEDTLTKLASLHPDISHAIVRLVNTSVREPARAPAELNTFGRRAVISVRPTPALERRVGVELVPLPDGRALISFDQPRTVADLEVTLRDALEDRRTTADERHLFESICTMLKSARQSSDIRLLRRNIIVLEYDGPPRGTPGATSGKTPSGASRAASPRRAAAR